MTEKHHTTRYLIITSVVAIIALSIWYYSRPKPPNVIVATATNGTVESIVANTRAGTVKACRRASLAPATGGQIEKLLVREGSRVKRNDILFEIWNQDLRAQLLLAIQQQKAAEAGAKERCVMADVSEHEAQRLTKLLKQKLASEEAADRAEGTAKANRAACEAAKESSKVSAAQVNVVQIAVDRTVVRAPFDGIVAEVNGEVGEFVTPSPMGIITLPVIDLIDNACIYVAAPIDEVDATSIKAGMDTRITLDAFKNQHFAGKVRRVAPYVMDREKQARTVDIEVEFSALVGDHGLLPGYSADTEIILDIKNDALRIPTEAIFDQNKVLVYKPDTSTLEQRTVEIGISNWSFTEIKQGLHAGELVVISAKREGLEDGTTVTVKDQSVGKDSTVKK